MACLFVEEVQLYSSIYMPEDIVVGFPGPFACSHSAKVIRILSLGQFVGLVLDVRN